MDGDPRSGNYSQNLCQTIGRDIPTKYCILDRDGAADAEPELKSSLGHLLHASIMSSIWNSIGTIGNFGMRPNFRRGCRQKNNIRGHNYSILPDHTQEDS